MNILILLTDQQRYDAVGYRQSWVRTPALDKLASQSVDCTCAYAQSPQCQPSRASLLTGRYPTAHKMWWNAIDLPTKEKTIANHMSDIGYNTAYFGKIHISEKQHEHKLTGHFGFTTSYLSSDWRRDFGHNQSVVEYTKIMDNKGWYGPLSNRKTQHDEIITDLAIQFITSKKPYFVVVGFYGPHPPYTAPKPYSRFYADKIFDSPDDTNANGDILSNQDWQQIKKYYFSSISWIDDNISKILRAVDDDTMVIYTSDHGDILGDHNLFSKGMYAYDGNTRVPLLIKAPQLKPQKYDYLVQHIDILPTILSMIGLPIPLAVQGKSLFDGFTKNILVNDYILSMIGWHPRLRMIRNYKYKYWLYGDKEMLFDVVSDPLENRTLNDSDLYINVMNYMRLSLLKALILAEDPSPRPFTYDLIPCTSRG